MKILDMISVLFFVMLVSVQARTVILPPFPPTQSAINIMEGCPDEKCVGDKWIPEGECAKCQCKKDSFFPSGRATECESCGPPLTEYQGFLIKKSPHCLEFPECCPKYIREDEAVAHR